eukprot:GHVU01170599.1.p1 GENE.GHVU01170599.1~~GHVU01170599.1.p1  ORF type:complete len:151 (-),score=2.21 GHVU01170599.1:764-1216(-)
MRIFVLVSVAALAHGAWIPQPQRSKPVAQLVSFAKKGMHNFLRATYPVPEFSSNDTLDQVSAQNDTTNSSYVAEAEPLCAGNECNRTELMLPEVGTSECAGRRTLLWLFLLHVHNKLKRAMLDVPPQPIGRRPLSMPHRSECRSAFMQKC